MTIRKINLQQLERIITGRAPRGAAYSCMIKFYSNNCPMCAEVKEVYHQVAKKHSSPTAAFFVHNIKETDLSSSQATLNINTVEDILKRLNDLNPEYKKVFNTDVQYSVTPLFLKVETGLSPGVADISIFLETDSSNPENPGRYIRNPTTQDFEDFFQDKSSKKVLTIK